MTWVPTVVLSQQSKEQAMLPKETVDELSRILGDKGATDGHEEAIAVLEASKKSSCTKANNLLNALAPDAVLDSHALMAALSENAAGNYVCEKAGFSRFQWMIAVAGGGSDRSPDAISAFLGAAAEWIAANILSNQLRLRRLEVSRGVDANPWFEASRRFMPVAVHMRWTSELICTSMAYEIVANNQKYSELAVVTPGAVQDIFTWVEAKGRHRDAEVSGSGAILVPELSRYALDLLEALSFAPGSSKGSPFDRLIFDLGNEAHPFAKFENGFDPVSAREATYRLELAFFHLARRLLSNDKDRSDLFEEVVNRCLRLSVPAGMELADGAARCPIPDTQNPGQTDFVLRDSTSTYVGECKSMVAAPKPYSVINNFTDDVGTATKQLDKRMQAFASGVNFLVDEQPWEAPRESVFGLAVPFHDYGGAVWHRDCLPLVKGVRPNMAVIPVHQMIMVMRAMSSGADLAAYIEFRALWLGRGHEVFDELDILVPFLFPDEFGHIDASAQFGVEHEARLSDPMPTSSEAWQRRLKAILQHL